MRPRSAAQVTDSSATNLSLWLCTRSRSQSEWCRHDGCVTKPAGRVAPSARSRCPRRLRRRDRGRGSSQTPSSACPGRVDPTGGARPPSVWHCLPTASIAARSGPNDLRSARPQATHSPQRRCGLAGYVRSRSQHCRAVADAYALDWGDRTVISYISLRERIHPQPRRRLDAAWSGESGRGNQPAYVNRFTLGREALW
jgi:hypothetical protein